MFTKVNLKYAGVNVLRKILFHPSVSRVHCGWRGKLPLLQLSGAQIVNITPGICSVCGLVTQDLEQTNKMGCDDACGV